MILFDVWYRGTEQAEIGQYWILVETFNTVRGKGQVGELRCVGEARLLLGCGLWRLVPG